MVGLTAMFPSCEFLKAVHWRGCLVAVTVVLFGFISVSYQHCLWGLAVFRVGSLEMDSS